MINSAWHITWIRKRSHSANFRDFSRLHKQVLRGSRLLTLLLQTLLRFWQSGKVEGRRERALLRVPRLGPLMALLQVEPRKVSLLLLLTQKRLNASIAMKKLIGSGTAQNTSKMWRMGKLNPTMQVFTLSFLITHPILNLGSLIPVVVFIFVVTCRD